MDALLSRLEARRDFNAVFVRSYRTVTSKMESGIHNGVFEDNRWMEALDVQFAQEYFDALEAYESGTGTVPTSWKLAFELAHQKKTTVLQDLLLGMNAHILHDLPIALHKTGVDPSRLELRKRDHEKVNEVLAGAIDEVQDEVTGHYSWALGFVDRLLGDKDELLTDAGIHAARKNAWSSARMLAGTRDDAARRDVLRNIDNEAAVEARWIASRLPWLTRLTVPLRRWDRALSQYFNRRM